jgi:hypothetical protein
MKALCIVLLFSIIALCSAASFVREFHASPNTPPVDIYIDGTRVVTNLAYAQFTPSYMSVSAGSHNVKVWPAGSTSGQGNPTINSDITVSENVFYTIFVVGTLAGTGNQAIQAVTYVDSPGLANVTRIRPLALSPNAVPVNMVLQANASALLLGNITYLQPNPIYVSLPPGEYALDFRPTDNNAIVAVSAANSTYAVSTSYSVALIGLADGSGTPPLATVILVDAVLPPGVTTAPPATTQAPTQTQTQTQTQPISSTTFPASAASSVSVILFAVLSVAVFLMMF